MLPQAVDMCLSSDSAVAYNEAAASYNERMHSFSGLLARWTGVSLSLIHIFLLVFPPRGLNFLPANP